MSWKDNLNKQYSGGNSTESSQDSISSWRDRINTPYLTVSYKQQRQEEERKKRNAQLYNQAVEQARQKQEEADKAKNSKWLRFGNFAGGLAKDMVKGSIVRPAVSLAEIPLNVASGGAKTFGKLNVPYLGEVQSYQSESQDISNQIIEGEKPLRSALAPMGEAVLDVGSLGLGGSIAKQGAKAGAKGLAKTIGKAGLEGGAYGGAYGGTEALKEGYGLKDSTKSIATSAGVGALLGGALSGVSVGVGKYIKKGTKASERVVNETTQEIEQTANTKLNETEKEALADAFEQGATKEDIVANVDKVASRKPTTLKRGELAPKINEIKAQVGDMTISQIDDAKGKLEQGWSTEDIVDDIVNPKPTKIKAPEAKERTTKAETLSKKIPKDKVKKAKDLETKIVGDTKTMATDTVSPIKDTKPTKKIVTNKKPKETTKKVEPTFDSDIKIYKEKKKKLNKKLKALRAKKEDANIIEQGAINIEILKVKDKISSFNTSIRSTETAKAKREGELGIKKQKHTTELRKEAKKYDTADEFVEVKAKNKGLIEQDKYFEIWKEANKEKQTKIKQQKLEQKRKTAELAKKTKAKNEQKIFEYDKEKGVDKLKSELVAIEKKLDTIYSKGSDTKYTGNAKITSQSAKTQAGVDLLIQRKFEIEKSIKNIEKEATKKLTKPKKPTEIKGSVEKKSITAQKLNQTLPDEYKISEEYDAIQLKDELNKASKDIAKDKDKALKDAYDTKKSTTSRIAKLTEFAEVAKRDNDYNTVNSIFSTIRKTATETAQGMNMLKGLYSVNPEFKFMKNVVDSRLKKISVGGKDIKKAMKEANKKIVQKGKEIKEVTRRAYKIKDAQDMLNKIMCK